ncbi:MAG: hypothetical protein ABSD89_02495 [Halobacteriota archaeon]
MWSLALALILIALVVTKAPIAIQRLAIAGVYTNLTTLIGILAGLRIGLLVTLIYLLSLAVGHGGGGLSRSEHDRELERDRARVLRPQNEKRPT